MTEMIARSRLRDYQADHAIILGSGLNAVVENPGESISYSAFPEIPAPSVPGHEGKFSLAEIGGHRVIFARGRVHLYEGWSAQEVTSIVRVLAEAGVKKLVVTNAAGALNAAFCPGDWMMITDHLNLTGASPLIGSAHFLDLSRAYSPALQTTFSAAAEKIGLKLQKGVYAAVVGPQYETPAEVRMLQRLGADAIGMSTVLEVIQARALGMEVAGFSCITNLAAGLSAMELSHEEVLETGRAAAEQFAALLRAVFERSSRAA